jgi:diguanylate cyclase (GGDEF)-like protein
MSVWGPDEVFVRNGEFMEFWTGERMPARWRLSALLVTSVMAVGLVGSGALVVAVNSQRQVHAQAVMDQRVQVIDSAVRAEVRRYVETTTDLAAAIGAQSDLSASDFAALTANLNRSRLPGVSGVSLVVPATDAETPRIQRLWRARGARQLSLAPAGTANEHLFSVLNHPLDGTAPRTGRDFSVAAEPTRAMAASRNRDRVTASPTYVLLRDRGLPAKQRQQSFVLAMPVLGGVGTAHEGKFQGWLLMGMRGRDFISETMELASQNMVAVTLVDGSTPAAAAVPVARVSHGQVVADEGLERRVDLQVAGRRWQLQVQPTTKFVASLGPSLSAPAGGAGVLLTVLLAILVGTLASSRSRALAKVESATTALRADITRRKRVQAALLGREKELQAMALTDSLTGLANRRAFMDQLEQSHARALRHNSPVYVLFCDVDHFKTINDTYGHAAGDAVLIEVATRLQDHFRTEDTVGRLGGDEFAVICEDGFGSIEVLVDRVRDALATPYLVRDDLIAASVSIGIASPQQGESSTQMLERADSTMYQAKAARPVA